MNTTLQQALSQTTVDVDMLEDFLLGFPYYHELGQVMGVDANTSRALYHADMVEFEIRQYLANRSPTRYHINREIRSFLAIDDYLARLMIHVSLDTIKTILLRHEWYEIASSHNRLCQHILKTFDI